MMKKDKKKDDEEIEDTEKATIIEVDRCQRQIQISKPNLQVLLLSECGKETMTYLVDEAKKLMDRYEG